jgi:hypothetical protein
MKRALVFGAALLVAAGTQLRSGDPRHRGSLFNR